MSHTLFFWLIKYNKYLAKKVKSHGRESVNKSWTKHEPIHPKCLQECVLTEGNLRKLLGNKSVEKPGRIEQFRRGCRPDLKGSFDANSRGASCLPRTQP